MNDREFEPNDDLVAAAVAGDRRTADRLMARLRPMLRAMVLARLSPRPHQAHDADDIIQDCSVAISTGLAGLRSPTFESLRSFASTVVSRRVADYLRSAAADRGRASPQPAGSDDGHSIWATLLADSLSPRAQAANREEVLRVAQAMIGLKESYREIITLALIDQLSMGEIAERLGIARPAASMRLIRALRTLRRDVTGSSRVPSNDGRDAGQRSDTGDD